jgi:pyruvate,water dikinase
MIKDKITEKIYFDSANIAESYSGVVLPLTCSFASMVYKQVYMDLLNMSGVSRAKLEKHSDIFSNLLGFYYGRMYYNMNNWYHMAEFVPGYKRNKDNFELMITSNIKEGVDRVVEPSFFLKIFYIPIVFLKVLTFGITSHFFKISVEKNLKRIRNYDFSVLNHSQSIELFNDLNKSLLRKWYITLENDFFVMTYMGILKKMLNEQDLQKAIIFQSKATEQVNAIINLSKSFQTDLEIWSTIEADNVKKFNTLVQGDIKLSEKLREYMDTFGGRFANELKLESVGIEEDTTKLFSVLKIYSKSEPIFTNTDYKISSGFIKKIIVFIALSKFKKFASRREKFRLLRSNTFAMARKLFRHIGDILVSEGKIDHKDDIFYLELDEILVTDELTKNSLLEKIKDRKNKYSSYDMKNPPSHFISVDGSMPFSDKSEGDVGDVIQASPASSGIIKGRAKVFKEFYIPNVIDFDILVTSHTDPGWTSLIALSKGLIIEHGGVLSHASIVARELGIPAVIGATNATNYIKDYSIVEINGSTGLIKK